MKPPCLIIFIITLLSGANVFCADAPLDSHFFTVVNTALDMPYPLGVKQWMAMSLGEKRTNAQALYLLDIEASKTEGISNAVRLAVAASATRTFGNYISAIPTPSPEFEDFLASSDLSAVLFLLGDSQKLLDQIPTRQVYLNVDVPGIAAAGMDPNGVKNLKARAEYERRIVENNQASEENNSRSILKNAIFALKNSIRRKIDFLAAEGKVELFRNGIETSSLPTEVKNELLKDYPPSRLNSTRQP